MPISSGGGGSSPLNIFDSANNTKLPLLANTAVQVLPANPNRKYAAIVVSSDAEITIALGGQTDSNTGVVTGVVIGEGIPLLGRGKSYEITSINLYTGQVSAICSVAASLSIVEGT
ncbi:hypothetical protein H6F74_05630 [Trichocoleus sp. FACHB-90]|uniref:hypothetical protein n=1 Tax=Cyanophyceae TaxID=3028117 RepID=UPI001687BDAE|nr:hypothetical protein [Trichocoleus sp. FACHB-90]MBD1925763.1 hypothetical protein [Trichocoleus sp. FACHB-90]